MYINNFLKANEIKDFGILQLALNTYWQSIGGTVLLPGTNRAADRFARTSFLIKNSQDIG